MIKPTPINANNLRVTPTSINDSEFMDINGNPYPQVLTFDNIRNI